MPFRDWLTMRGRKAPPASAVLIALLVTGLVTVVPGAVNTIWTDRAVVTELRQSLVSEVATIVGETIKGSHLIVSHALPENVLARLICPPDAILTLQARQILTDDCYEALVSRQKAQQVHGNELIGVRIVRGSVIMSQLETYFPEDRALVSEGAMLFQALDVYLNLVTVICGDVRASHVEYLRSYVNAEQSDVAPLLLAEYDNCENVPSLELFDVEFQAAYVRLGEGIQARSVGFLAEIGAAQPTHLRNTTVEWALAGGGMILIAIAVGSAWAALVLKRNEQE